MEIGKRIAILRKKEGWTQQELADRLHVTDKAVSKWEQGLGFPELTTVVKLSEVFKTSTDYLLKNEEVTMSKTQIWEENEMKTGEFIEARTHADFLNKLLDKDYRGYMKCTFDFDGRNLIWMIRLDGNETSTGWRNSLECGGEKIIENYVGEENKRLEPHKIFPGYQRRYVFDIIEKPWGQRKYVFKGIFEFAKDEGDNDYRVWNKISDTADFKALLNA